MSNNEVYFPFGSITPAIIPQVIPYDLVVQEAYPGIVLAPTEPNGVYSVYREVSGCTWWVLNADFNDDTERWEQDSPTNAVLPAYALEQCQSGTLVRYVAAATVIPGNPIIWIPVWTIDANGFQVIEPVTITQAGQIAQIIDVTWNAGSSTVAGARQIQATDTSSAPGTLLDDLAVNGTSVWQVRKDGTLVTGKVPGSAITGPINNATFTGTSTFDGPATFNQPITANGGIVNPGGGSVGDVPAYTSATTTVPANGSTVTIAISSSHGFPLGSTVLVAGTDGTNTKAYKGFVTTNNGSPQTSITIQVTAVLSGNPGDNINSGATVSYTTVVPLVSPIGTIAISNGGTAIAPQYDIDMANPFPLAVGPYTMPAVGSSVSLTGFNSAAIVAGAYVTVFVSGNPSPFEFSGRVTSSITSGNTVTLVVECQEIITGTPGAAVTVESLVSFGYPSFPIGYYAVVGSYTATVPGPTGSVWNTEFKGTVNIQTTASFSVTYAGTLQGSSGSGWHNQVVMYSGYPPGATPILNVGTTKAGDAVSVTLNVTSGTAILGSGFISTSRVQ